VDYTTATNDASSEIEILVLPLGESLLSTPDNTSLANYSHDYELVDRMRVFPFESRTAVVLAIAALIPMVPLLATVMPMEEIFKLLLKAMG
jgi:hypothetical protein